MMVIFRGLHGEVNTQENTQESTQEKFLSVKEKQILEFCSSPKSKKEIAEYLGYKTIKSVKKEIGNLLTIGYLQMLIPEQPNNRNQKYVVTKKK